MKGIKTSNVDILNELKAEYFDKKYNPIRDIQPFDSKQLWLNSREELFIKSGIARSEIRCYRGRNVL